ncbi:MAG: pyruvate dehydrogenase complex E1 component subunit beta [Alphaproteobacteria bacterium]|nr:pyruvate dehydrogenase complex E1 component subunit beta [Alphaproteobacteria bacterium]
MAKLQIREALRRALREEMLRDESVFLMGEEVAHYNGAYKVSQGLLDEFGEDRVVDTPIAEGGFAGLGVGAAMAGMRPVIEFMTFNFSLVAYDQVINSAAKVFQMSGGQYKVPIVFRGANGAAENLGSQHSTSVDSIYAHFPGLKVVTYCDAHDAYGLLKSAIRDDNPVVFLESELTYGVKGEVPDHEFLIPLGQAKIRREGTDVTLVTWGKQVMMVEAAAAQLAEQGISAEVIDLRSIRPLDQDTLFSSVAKTGHCVIVQEGYPFAGIAAELAARVQEACFDWLDAPVLRVCNRDVNQPYAPNLEKLVMPSPPRVIAAVHRVLGRDVAQDNALDLPQQGA